MRKVLTKNQLEVVKNYYEMYSIDITKKWFSYSIQKITDDNEYKDEYDYFICVWPKDESDFDQDTMIESFVPNNIQIDNLLENVYAYNGDKKILVDTLNGTGFFSQEK